MFEPFRKLKVYWFRSLLPLLSLFLMFFTDLDCIFDSSLGIGAVLGVSSSVSVLLTFYKNTLFESTNRCSTMFVSSSLSSCSYSSLMTLGFCLSN